MSNYDFLILSPFEFESLTRSLLQKHLDCYIESFTSGRDGGIDLRCASVKDTSAIIQCKRYKDYSSLKRELAKEVEKVQSLSPSRYYVSTTVGLTPANKDEIKEMFSPYIQDTADIFGKDDLNNLLEQYPDVEKQHYKLWLCSTAVMEKIINRRVVNWSKLEYQTCLDESKKYVMNKSFDQAMDKLQEYHYVIISGIPGIGKTTLARQLIFRKLGEDYDEFICVTDDLDNAMDLLEDGKKQIFFFDDFLGKTFFERGEKGFESKLVSFIRHIRRTQDKLLILTTREYILQDAKQYYETFERTKLDLSKCVVDLGSYTSKIRARILYNHLAYSTIPVEYLRNFVDVYYKYWSLIDHKNFNPRVIEAFIDHEEWKDASPADFYRKFRYVFDHPNSVWEMAFNKLDIQSQYALIVLVTLHRPCLLEDWRSAFKAFSDATKDMYALSKDDKLWKQSLKRLDGSFIKSELRGGEHMFVDFFNPSIHDFLVDHITERSELIDKLILGSIFIEQLYEQFTSIHMNHKINIQGDLLRRLSERFVELFNPISGNVRTCIARVGNKQQVIYKRFDLFDCLATLYTNLPELKSVDMLDIRQFSLIEKELLNYSYDMDDRLKVLDVAGDHFVSSDKRTLYYRMSEDIYNTHEFVSYFTFGKKHGYDIGLIAQSGFVRGMEEKIRQDIGNCSYEVWIDELEEKISELSSLLPNWDTDHIQADLEQRRIELGEKDDSDTDAGTSSRYYHIDHADIREMFESLKG